MGSRLYIRNVGSPSKGERANRLIDLSWRVQSEIWSIKFAGRDCLATTAFARKRALGIGLGVAAEAPREYSVTHHV